jgi:dTDP-4-amino-4,6-dideoxygalactose transaminase
MIDKRVLYATAVYDQDEIDAVLGVLNGGKGTLRIGKHVAEMERGMLVPMSYALEDDDIAYVCDQIEAFVRPRI